MKEGAIDINTKFSAFELRSAPKKNQCRRLLRLVMKFDDIRMFFFHAQSLYSSASVLHLFLPAISSLNISQSTMFDLGGGVHADETADVFDMLGVSCLL